MTDVSAADTIPKELDRMKHSFCFTLQVTGIEALNATTARDTISMAPLRISTLPILLPAGIGITAAHDVQKLRTSLEKGKKKK